MADGAHYGLRAEDAMRRVVAGDPIKSEPLPNPEMEALIRSRPLPDQDQHVTNDYSEMSEIIAHCFLVLEDEDPGILDRDTLFSSENTEYEDLWGKSMGKDHAPWEAAKVKWGQAFDDVCGGASGFMVGWALNAARSIKGYGPTRNPAII